MEREPAWAAQFLQALVAKPKFWFSFVSILFALCLARGLASGRPPVAPPSLGPFPDFRLTDDRGNVVTPQFLEGHAFLANLARPSDRASASETMRKLQHRSRNLGAQLLLLTFEEGSNPHELSLTRNAHPSSERWFLLDGATPELENLFRDSALVLVGPDRRIRGTWKGTAPHDLDAALRDAALTLGGK